MSAPCCYGSHDCGKNNMGLCIHHQRDALLLALESCVIVLEACSARKSATVKRVTSEARKIMKGNEDVISNLRRE